MLKGHFLTGSNQSPFQPRNLLPNLAPFFAYKDTTIYMPASNFWTRSSIEFFDTIYREWYPTRDKTHFNHGIYGSIGGSFFSSTIIVHFDSDPPQTPCQLAMLIYRHTALLHRIEEIIPHFHYLKEGGAGLAQSRLTEHELEELPTTWGKPTRYDPVLQSTFKECLLYIDGDWSEDGVCLVVLKDTALRKLDCEKLARDHDLEGQTKKAMHELGFREEEGFDEDAKIGFKMIVEHVTIWRGSLIEVMRAVVAQDETRKLGRRDFNWELDEWLGEGINVGIDGEPLAESGTFSIAA